MNLQSSSKMHQTRKQARYRHISMFGSKCCFVLLTCCLPRSCASFGTSQRSTVDENTKVVDEVEKTCDKQEPDSVLMDSDATESVDLEDLLANYQDDTEAPHQSTISDIKQADVVPVASIVFHCRYEHDGPAQFKEETNAAYAKPKYYLNGKMCLGCSALITNEGKGGRREEEGQFFVKPSARHPVWACRGVPSGDCDQVMCNDCFTTKFMK